MDDLLHATPARSRTGTREKDPLAQLAWLLCLAGALVTPAGVARVGGFALSDVIFLTSAVLFAASGAQKPRPAATFQIAIVFGLIATIGSSVSAVSVSDALLVGMRILYVWTIWQWGLRGLGSSPERLAAISAAFLVGATASGVTGFLQVYAGLTVPGADLVNGRAPGLQFHPNGQGGVLAGAFPIALAFVTAPRARVLGVVGVAGVLVGLLTSGSVSGMLGAAIGTLVFLVLRRTTIRALLVVTLVMGFAAVIVANLDRIIPGAVSPLTRLLDSTGYGEGESTFDSRLVTIHYALERIIENPVWGNGLDTASGVTANGVTLAHNMPVLVWFQGGLFLLCGVLIVVWWALQKAARLALSGDTVFAGIAAAGFAVAVVAMSGPVLYDRWFWFPVLLCSCAATMRAARASHVMVKQPR